MRTRADCAEFEADFSDYYEGALPADRRAALEKHLAEHPACQAEYQRFKGAMSAVSGLHRVEAPRDFDDKVADTIHRRSAGRFFGRRAFGERVPYELIAGIFLALLVAVYLAVRFSGTGTVHDSLAPGAPEIPDEARRAVPTP